LTQHQALARVPQARGDLNRNAKNRRPNCDLELGRATNPNLNSIGAQHRSAHFKACLQSYAVRACYRVHIALHF